MTPLSTDPRQPVIKPGIGRRLWYWPSITDQIKTATSMAILSPYQALDAGVCYVHTTRCVNLLVTDHAGRLHERASVRLLQGDEQPQPGQAHVQWLSRQVVQAARTELLNGETANVLQTLGSHLLLLVTELRELRRLVQAAKDGA